MSLWGRLAVAGLLLTTPPAWADWLPQWISRWAHPSASHATDVVAIGGAADGATLAYASVYYEGKRHDVLLRFEADGQLGWMNEKVGNPAGMAVIDGGRVAVAGMNEIAVVFVRVYDARDGHLLWQSEADAGPQIQAFASVRTIVQAANGDLLVRAQEQGDYVVLRFTADGTVLTPWRWRAADELATTSDIAAVPDGGVVVAGWGDAVGGGFRTVRFGGDGHIVFADVELGDLGNPLGTAFVAVDARGDAIVAGSPETRFGVPQAAVWKIAADGSRQWQWRIADPDSRLTSLIAQGLAASPHGDVAFGIQPLSERPFRLIRLDGATGALRSDAASPLRGTPTHLVQGANGRLLIAGYGPIDVSGHAGPLIVEFTADGQPCRAAANLAGIRDVIPAAASGWSLLGAGPFDPQVGNDLFVQRHDADGLCDGVPDVIFAYGFESLLP